MSPRRTWPRGWTRRHLFLMASAGWAQQRKTERALRRRYLDPATEFEVFRLTDPDYRSLLAKPYNQIFSRKGGFVLCASDRGGSLQAWALPLKGGTTRQLTEAAALDPASLTLTPDERNLCYLDGGALWMTPAGGGRGRRVWSGQAAEGAGMSITADGPSALVVGGSRLLRVNLLRGDETLVAEGEQIRDPMPRPKRAAVLYRSGAEDWYLAHLDGSRNTKVKMAGRAIYARWAPDGRTILYLSVPGEPGKATQLREVTPDTGEDRLIGPTSQFGSFSPNGDASVFAGASVSKAQPHVLLLLRSVKREFTLCEHKSSDPAAVSPVFTPDSQQIFFQSDREGKPAIYSMMVERLVEKTEAGETVNF